MPTSARTPVIVASACAAAFAAVLVLASRVPAAVAADADIVRALTRLGGSGIGTLASIVAHSAVLVVPLGLCAILGWGIAAGRYRETVAAAALVAVAMVVAEGTKIVLDHPRFREMLGLHEFGADNFPSGHAAATTALAFAALLVALPEHRRFALAVGGAYALSVCASVLILGWHLPSDVVGGVLLSSFCFCAVLAALRIGRSRDAESRGPALSRH